MRGWQWPRPAQSAWLPHLVERPACNQFRAMRTQPGNSAGATGKEKLSTQVDHLTDRPGASGGDEMSWREGLPEAETNPEECRAQRWQETDSDDIVWVLDPAKSLPFQLQELIRFFSKPLWIRFLSFATWREDRDRFFWHFIKTEKVLKYKMSLYQRC